MNEWITELTFVHEQSLNTLERLDEKGDQEPGETGRGESFRIRHIGIGGLKNKWCSVLVFTPLQNKVV